MADPGLVPPVTAIDEAIERVAVAPSPLPTVTLRFTPQGLMLRPAGTLRFSQPIGINGPRLFLLDPAADVWVPIAMPPGEWQIGPQRDDSLPPIGPPKLWVPS